MNKKSLILIVLISVFTSTPMFANNEIINTPYLREGVGLGTILAVVTSWSRNKSILLAIIHGLFSWFYVIYFAITEKN